jgi:hypothetical protein
MSPSSAIAARVDDTIGSAEPVFDRHNLLSKDEQGLFRRPNDWRVEDRAFPIQCFCWCRSAAAPGASLEHRVQFRSQNTASFVILCLMQLPPALRIIEGESLPRRSAFQIPFVTGPSRLGDGLHALEPVKARGHSIACDRLFRIGSLG